MCSLRKRHQKFYFPQKFATAILFFHGCVKLAQKKSNISFLMIISVPHYILNFLYLIIVPLLELSKRKCVPKNFSEYLDLLYS